MVRLVFEEGDSIVERCPKQREYSSLPCSEGDMDLGAEHCSRLRGAQCISTCHSAIAVDLLRVELAAQKSGWEGDERYPLHGHFVPYG